MVVVPDNHQLQGTRMARPVTDPSFREYKVRLGDTARGKLDLAATDFAEANGKEAAQAELIRWVIEQYAPQTAVAGRSADGPGVEVELEVSEGTLAQLEAIQAERGVNRTEAIRLAVAAYGHGIINPAVNTATVVPPSRRKATNEGLTLASEASAGESPVDEPAGDTDEPGVAPEPLSSKRMAIPARPATPYVGPRTSLLRETPVAIPDLPTARRASNPVADARMARLNGGA